MPLFRHRYLTGINARRRDEFISGGSAIPGT
jgi:hypothetical protein